MTEAVESNVLTRWVVPAGVVWSELLLSAWVYTKKLDEPAQEPTTKLLIAFLGMPAFSLLLLVVLRFVAKRASSAHSRNGDLLIVWVVTFLFCIHAAVLAAVIGMFSLSQAVPVAVGLLMIGLGPVLGSLEPGSAMGIRTKATLRDPVVWERTHRLASRLFILAGLLGLSALLFEGIWVLFASVVPAILAVVLAIIYAARLPIDAADEHPREEERPSG